MRGAAAAKAYVLSHCSNNCWYVVDHGDSFADMEASAQRRARFCADRGFRPGRFIAVAHSELAGMLTKRG